MNPKLQPLLPQVCFPERSVLFCDRFPYMFWISFPLPDVVHLEMRLIFSVSPTDPFSPGLTQKAKSSGVWGNGFTLAHCGCGLTVIKPVYMHVLLSPIRPYCTNVCWLSSGRLEKDSYPYAWEPKSRRDRSPEGTLCLLAHPPWSHIAGGSEDQWASTINSSPLHISSLISRGGPRGTQYVSLLHTGRNRDVFHYSNCSVIVLYYCRDHHCGLVMTDLPCPHV